MKLLEVLTRVKLGYRTAKAHDRQLTFFRRKQVPKKQDLSIIYYEEAGVLSSCFLEKRHCTLTIHWGKGGGLVATLCSPLGYYCLG